KHCPPAPAPGPAPLTEIHSCSSPEPFIVSLLYGQAKAAGKWNASSLRLCLAQTQQMQAGFTARDPVKRIEVWRRRKACRLCFFHHRHGAICEPAACHSRSQRRFSKLLAIGRIGEN